MNNNKATGIETGKNARVTFKIFRAGGIDAWEKPMAAAAQFASTLGRHQIVSISHSSDAGSGTVVVWYEEGMKS